MVLLAPTYGNRNQIINQKSETDPGIYEIGVEKSKIVNTKIF
jgi:hypothetical protein